MPFGRYKGQRIRRIPTEYLMSLYEKGEIDAVFRKWIERNIMPAYLRNEKQNQMDKYQIAMVIPVHDRLEVTAHCYRVLKHFICESRTRGVDIDVWVVTDDADHHELAMSFGWKIIIAKNDFVSNKLNTAIRSLVPFKKYYDYMVLLGSDNELHLSIWDKVIPEMEAGTHFFGFSEVKFRKWGSQEYLNASYEMTTGVARFHRMDTLAEIAVRYKCFVLESHVSGSNAFKEGDVMVLDRPTSSMKVLSTHIGIWTPDMQTGMDNDSEAYINSRGYQIKHLRGLYITDWKSDVNLTSWDEIANNLTMINADTETK